MSDYYRLIRGIICVAILVLPVACGDDDPTGQEDNFDRTAMLENYANNIIIPSYAALQTSVSALEVQSSSFKSSPDATTLLELQQALKAVRLAWQSVNFFQFGPAESSTLRSSLNTYPTDVDLIEANIENGNYIFGTLANIPAAGFPALDYLLHGVGANDQDIITLYTTGDNATKRLTYLEDNITFIKSKVDQTMLGWSTAGDAYLNEFLSEDNAGTDVGSSTGLFVNSMVLQYERFTRDGKIAIPGGVRSAGIPRPKTTESYYGGYSVELAKENLTVLARLFDGQSPNGQNGLGLSDYLGSIGSDAVAQAIKTELEEAIVAVGALNDPLSNQIETDLDPVLVAFTAMQDAVVLMKVDMSSLLGITITFQDNDGD